MNLFIFPISEVSQKEPLRLNYTRTKNKFESTNKYNYMNLKEETNKKGKNNYTKFILMLAGSFIAMYITMYLNTYQIDHVYFSLTRLYMTCLESGRASCRERV